MLRLVLLSLVVWALALAGPATTTVHLWQPALVAGAELQPGEYTLVLDGERIQLKRGRTVVEARVRLASSAARHPATTLIMEQRDGKLHLKEILLGRSTTRLVLE